MSLSIVRFRYNQSVQWGAYKQNAVYPLDIPCSTTAALVSLGYPTVANAVASAFASAFASANIAIAADEVTLLSPITQDAKVLCQGANYRQHMIDSGMNPDEKSFNMFFTKSSASITDPQGNIIRPKHVELLDYEIEMTLVMAKQTDNSVTVTNGNLHEYVAGVCIANDISARDVQIPQMQFHKGKSYRTFCPLGPVLCLLNEDEMHYLNNLQLTLSVNGEVRQTDNTSNMVYKPAETISEYSQIVDFNPGDVILTGTPVNCALAIPSPLFVRIASLLPEKKKWALFLKSQKKRAQYLNDGDIVESIIRSPDGVIDLGRQHHKIVAESRS